MTSRARSREPGERSGPAFLPRSLWSSADLGTNTFRLLVARETAPGTLKLVELHQQVVRLGEGLESRGTLAPAALARAEELLLRFRARLDSLGVEHRLGGVTAAGREASDGAAFASRATELLGGGVRILAGEEEARLSAAGALSLVDVGDKDALFVDIGGGSTEVVAIRRGRAELAVSVPTGVVRLFEALPSSANGLDLTTLESLSRTAAELLPPSFDVARWRAAFAGGDGVFLATAGTPLTVAAEVKGLSIKDTRRLNGTAVSAGELEAVWARLTGLSTAERRCLPSMEPGREDVIVAGMALLRSLLKHFGSPGFTASDGGLLEGLLLDAVARVRGEDVRWVKPGVPGDRLGR